MLPAAAGLPYTPDKLVSVQGYRDHLARQLIRALAPKPAKLPATEHALSQVTTYGGTLPQS